MKKVFIFIAIPLCLILLIAFSIFIYNKINEGKTNNAVISLGESEKFSKSEIQDAANCVLKRFKKNFYNCDLKTLCYDEEKSNHEVESYMIYGGGTAKRIKKENVIVFYSDYYVGPDVEPVGSLQPDSFNYDFGWIVIRDSKNGKWRVGDAGYG